MKVITSNTLEKKSEFAIQFTRETDDIYIDNEISRISIKTLYKELKQQYTSRFRGAIVYSEKTFRNNIRRTIEIMSQYFGERFNLEWAVKSSPVRELVKIAAEENAAFDVGSYEELVLASEFTDGKNIYHTAPGKFDWDIEAIVKNKCVSISDNLMELREINDLSKSYDFITDIGIRINPAISSHTQKEISTGGLDCKFGLPEMNESFFNEVKKMTHINIRVLHMHIGSQVSEPDDYLLALKSMTGVYKSFTDHGIKIDTIDIGGGFPHCYMESRENDIRVSEENHAFMNFVPYTFEDYISKIASSIKSALGNDHPRISIQPGRHITAGTAFAIGHILNVKQYPNDIRWLMSSVSTNDINEKMGSPDFFVDFHILPQIPSSEQVPTAIGGALCFSGDILTPWETSVNAPKIISRNDIILYTNIGAYSVFGSGNCHNIPRLPILMIDRQSNLIEIRPQEKPYFE
ncbi:MAG: hypothetical protein K9L30_16650 [Desulfobacterales bacterium]|nr:hypothetical protein [Desulfobacterales bacterium]